MTKRSAPQHNSYRSQRRRRIAKRVAIAGAVGATGIAVVGAGYGANYAHRKHTNTKLKRQVAVERGLAGMRTPKSHGEKFSHAAFIQSQAHMRLATNNLTPKRSPRANRAATRRRDEMRRRSAGRRIK
jgi:hypothetical protein